MNAVRGQKKKDINSTAHLGSLAAFLHKRCPNLEDLHLSYDFHANMSASRLDAFFQIKSLKRMNVAELAGFHDTEYAPAQIACKSLEVLNFNLYFNVESLKKLLQVSHAYTILSIVVVAMRLVLIFDLVLGLAKLEGIIRAECQSRLLKSQECIFVSEKTGTPGPQVLQHASGFACENLPVVTLHNVLSVYIRT